MKSLNIVDKVIIIAIILGIVGFFAVKLNLHQTSSNIIERKASIEFDVNFMAQPISSKASLFKKGDDAFITIRNVPYTKLQIVDYTCTPWEMSVYDNTKNVFAIKDPSRSDIYNIQVTLKDDAIITPDGAVIGGNKIKIGLPITIEGFNYRLNGVVSDVRIENEQ